MKTFARLAPCTGSGLGRAIHKMRDLDELTTQLESIVEVFACDFGGYSGVRQRDRLTPSHDEMNISMDEKSRISTNFIQKNDISMGRRGGTSAENSSHDHISMGKKGGICIGVKLRRAGTALPIVADRINFSTAPRFAARKFLSDPLVRAVFSDPRWAEKSSAGSGSASRVQVCGSRVEVF